MSDSTVRGHALGQRPGWADEMAAMLAAYREAGGAPDVLQLPQVATLMVSANEVLAAHQVRGVRFEARPFGQGVQVAITVERGARVERPVHLCFGVVPAEGRQYILAYYDIGAGAQVEFLAHCSFPNAIKVQHIMQADVRVGAGASMTYTEAHYHGPAGGVEVRPRAEVKVSEGGRFVTTFNLARGRAGLLELDYHVDVSADAWPS